MNLLSRVGRQPEADQAYPGQPLSPSDEAARRARLAERAVAAEAHAFGTVRAALIAAAAAEDKGRARDRMVAAAGTLGLVTTVAVAIPRLVPYEFAGPVWAVGTLLLLLPLGLVTRQAFRQGRDPGLTLSVEAAQARACGLFAGRLGRALEPTALHSRASLDPRTPLGELVAGVEADVAKITSLVRPSAGQGRRHRRIVPRQCKVVIKTGDGRSLVGNLKDVSLSGVALSERLPRVAVGDKVIIGSHPATVARVWEDGMGLRFETMLNAATFDENMVL